MFFRTDRATFPFLAFSNDFFILSPLPVETLVHAMLGSGFPVALQDRNTSLSASTDILAVVTVVIWGFSPPLPAPRIHGKGGAAVGRRELNRPATKTHLNTK